MSNKDNIRGNDLDMENLFSNEKQTPSDVMDMAVLDMAHLALLENQKPNRSDNVKFRKFAPFMATAAVILLGVILVPTIMRTPGANLDSSTLETHSPTLQPSETIVEKSIQAETNAEAELAEREIMESSETASTSSIASDTTDTVIGVAPLTSAAPPKQAQRQIVELNQIKAEDASALNATKSARSIAITQLPETIQAPAPAPGPESGISNNLVLKENIEIGSRRSKDIDNRSLSIKNQGSNNNNPHSMDANGISADSDIAVNSLQKKQTGKPKKTYRASEYRWVIEIHRLYANAELKNALDELIEFRKTHRESLYENTFPDDLLTEAKNRSIPD